jgi:hypothetical protein
VKESISGQQRNAEMSGIKPVSLPVVCYLQDVIIVILGVYAGFEADVYGCLKKYESCVIGLGDLIVDRASARPVLILSAISVT